MSGPEDSSGESEPTRRNVPAFDPTSLDKYSDKYSWGPVASMPAPPRKIWRRLLWTLVTALIATTSPFIVSLTVEPQIKFFPSTISDPAGYTVTLLSESKFNLAKSSEVYAFICPPKITDGTGCPPKSKVNQGNGESASSEIFKSPIGGKPGYSASLTSSSPEKLRVVELTPESSIQLIKSPAQWAEWGWALNPQSTGNYAVVLTIKPVDAKGRVAEFSPPLVMTTRVEVTEAPASALKDIKLGEIWDAVKWVFGALLVIISAVGALGIGPSIIERLRRRKHTDGTPATEPRTGPPAEDSPPDTARSP